MKSIIAELWDGSLLPQENLLFRDADIADTFEKSEEIREEIEQRLTDEGKNLLDQYDEANLMMSGKSEEEAFRRGIAVGIRLMVEVTEYDDV